MPHFTLHPAAIALWPRSADRIAKSVVVPRESSPTVRVLWVKAGGILPLDSGGKIRSYHTLRELARRHEVTLFTFYEEQATDAHLELQGLLAQVITVPLRLPRRRSLADHALFARLLAAGQSYTMGKYYLPELRQRLGKLLGEARFDVIVCDFIYPAGLLQWPQASPVVLFTHNVEAEVWERQCRLTRNAARKLAFWLEGRALARAERRYSQLADHVVTISKSNLDFFGQFVDAHKLSLAPTGVDTDYFRPAPQAESDHDLVFTGSMDWLPNEDSVLYFVREILPLIREQEPRVRFWAVGRRASAALESLADNRSVFVTGTVDDIRPYLDRAAVYVVPMRSGSGTRLKVFEAMAAAKAVVSTTIGAEGLPVTPGEDILLADTPVEFAAAVVRLLRDKALRRRMGDAARSRVESEYSWAAAAAQFESTLMRVAAQRPQTAPR